MLANGFAVGVVAAVVGTVLGVTAWIVAAPHLEASAGHRIDPTAVPVWLVVAGMALAIVTAVAAAWWPARVVARVPITRALSARPARPEPVRRSLPAAVVLMVVGVLVLRLAFSDMRAVDGLLVVVGVLGVVLGVLLILAMTVGLLRGEAAGDLRTLAATGASSRVRRTITAATAATMALLGAVLGTAGAYLALIPAYAHDLSLLGVVPAAHLAVIVLGLPLLAAASAWLLAIREPPLLTPHPLD